MGKGKGGISHWIVPVRKGQILFEISDSNLVKVNLVLTKAIERLPFTSKIVFTKY
jgi:ribosomal protein L16/L10AE